MHRTLAILLAPLALGSGCGQEGEVACCMYETRVSGCGNANFGDWETRFFSIDEAELDTGTSAAEVCGGFSGSEVDTEVCDITVEYRKARLVDQGC